APPGSARPLRAESSLRAPPRLAEFSPHGGSSFHKSLTWARKIRPRAVLSVPWIPSSGNNQRFILALRVREIEAQHDGELLADKADDLLIARFVRAVGPRYHYQQSNSLPRCIDGLSKCILNRR